MASSTWVLDPTHSEIQFKVKHLMISNVTGQFLVMDGSVTSDDDSFSNASVRFTANADSIHTGNDQRDGHLKGAEFFDVEQFPEIVFVSDRFNANDGRVQGELTVKGVTRPVDLEVEFAGVNKDPWGNTKAGFSLTGKINRKDWDLNWNAALETGGFLVSDEVKILAEIQFAKQA